MTPGLCFHMGWEKDRPKRELSVLRETGAVVLVSLGVAVALAILLGALRAWRPNLTPDVGLLLLGGKDRISYVREHLPFLLLWAAALVSLGCVAGYVVARLAVDRARSRPPKAGITFVSEWWHVLHDLPAAEFPDCLVHVGCQLDDGSWVEGAVYRFSPDMEETGDRDLVLGPPLRFRSATADEGAEREVSFMVVSARRIVSMEVSYVPEAPPPTASEPDGRNSGE
jgi:hypothetical protein